MNIRAITATAVLTTAAVAAGYGTGHAAPQDTIAYETKLVDRAIVTTIAAGNFDVAKDSKSFSIKDTTGGVVMTVPLEVKLGELSIPLRHEVGAEGKVLKLTPDASKVALGDVSKLLLKPVASTAEDAQAMSQFKRQLGLATTIGGVAGTILGAAAGCILSIMVACVPGALAGAPIGGLLGTIVAGGPTLVISGIQLLDTMSAAPGSTKYAEKPPTTSGDGAVSESQPTVG